MPFKTLAYWPPLLNRIFAQNRTIVLFNSITNMQFLVFTKHGICQLTTTKDGTKKCKKTSCFGFYSFTVTTTWYFTTRYLTTWFENEYQLMAPVRIEAERRLLTLVKSWFKVFHLHRLRCGPLIPLWSWVSAVPRGFFSTPKTVKSQIKVRIYSGKVGSKFCSFSSCGAEKLLFPCWWVLSAVAINY